MCFCQSSVLQIPFPSDLNTDLVVEKGGKAAFRLALASLLAQPCSERGRFEDSQCLLCCIGDGSKTEPRVRVCALLLPWALILSARWLLNWRCSPGALLSFSGTARLVGEAESF